MKGIVAAALGCDPRWMETASGFTAVLWGIYLVVVPEAGLAGHASTAPLARFAADWLWIALALSGGALQMAAAWMDRLDARLVCSMVIGAMYLLLADGVHLGAPWAQVIPMYLGAAAANGWAMLLLATILLRKRRVP